ncbi:MAG: gamma-glutamyltranspeptidase/glutathione hydrolase [Saprospiraceae bacterium]|jgi:gamma-glutamyltranspeptidase/glutathione hydrolase
MNGKISAGHHVTAQAASEILKIGGNAVDAAIAAMFASFVAEPCMSSAGGGAFANVLFNGKARVYDFFCQTPRQKRPVSEVDFFPITVDFGDTTEDFYVGRGSVAVPGAIAGAFALHRDFGSIPMRELVQPAMEFAKNGVEVVPFQYLDFQLLESILQVSDVSKSIYFKEDGTLKNIGESQKMPQFVDFLDFISREGEAAFYQGEIARKVADDQARNGGYLTREDFEKYEVIIREPLSFKYRDYEILTNPLPSTGGSLMALMMMNLEKVTDNHLSKKHILNVLNTLETVQDFGKLPHQLAKALMQNLKKHTSKNGSTTHFNIVDKYGNAVSLTSTNGEGCGSYIENTQVQLNNMLGESALVPEGFHNWKPNTRLSSMMAPTLVLDNQKEFKATLGSGGAGRIPSMMMQVLHHLVDYNLPLEEAVMTPRIHLSGGQLNIENDGFEAIPDNKDIDHELIVFNQKSLFFGGVHAIVKEKETLIGVADARREGVVI